MRASTPCMDSDTSLRRHKQPPGFAAVDIATLVARLRATAGDAPVPLLVLRLRDLERIAWREGRSAARVVERRILRTFTATASRTLRASDMLAHDDESEDFIAALVSPTRGEGAIAAPADCRATLARLASAMELDGSMQIETGWTMLRGIGADEHLAIAIETALERGARERERYAFFSTIGHELRTPLTSIRGYLETLLDEDLDPATARRFLEVARNEAMRLGRLVDGMFDISMLDLRAGVSRRESTELQTSISAAIHAVAPIAADRGARIVQLAFGTGDVATNADRLTQILLNVLENAVKHGRDGGVVFVSVVALDARYVEVRIDDDGPGIDPLERDDVFELGHRGSSARGAGSGIGLAIVRLMIERIGGEVEVGDSAFGGARFSIRLPLLSEADDTSAAEASR